MAAYLMFSPTFFSYDGKYVCVAIDACSRFVSVIPLKNKYANTFMEAMKESFIMNGKPKLINSDNGS